VVLAYDWLTGMRGGEKVLEAICRILPDAPIVTLVHQPGSVVPLIEARTIRPSIVQRLPAPARWYRHYLPLFPIAIEGFDLDEADLVVSISHCAAKSVVKTGRARHICYCNSPMRYAWDQFDAYFGADRVGTIGNAVLRPVLAGLARWDRATAGRVDRFLGNSAHVAGRIEQYYNRRASVLYPPVSTDFFTPGDAPPDPYFLVVSALVPYKRIDTAIAAAGLLRVPVKVVGTGPDEARLRALAGPTVEFLGGLGDEDVRALYRRAQAVLLPGEEDFGIVPVEAMACGRPVVALDRGGARETVTHGVTGWLVSDPAPSAFADAMDHARRQPLDPAAARAGAERFSPARFEAGFRAMLTESLSPSVSAGAGC
jgi:glycosyltransferase involved in cell wall biosynthesis